MQGEKTTFLLRLQQNFLLLKQLLLIVPERWLSCNRHDIYHSHIKHTINKTDHQSILKTENMLLK
jgi:hypothetical protein